MQARTLRHDLTRWVSVDPLWPLQLAYTYVQSNPATHVDPTGTWRQLPRMPVRFPGMPGEVPIGVQEPTGFGLAVYGFVSLIGDIWDTCTGTSPAQSTTPIPIRTTYTLQECIELHKEYHGVCEGLPLCRGGMSCRQLQAAWESRNFCAALRLEINVCDTFPPKGWIPKRCGHLKMACEAAKAACNCARLAMGSGGRVCAWAGNSRIKQNCNAACTFCEAAAASCPLDSFGRWKCPMFKN